MKISKLKNLTSVYNGNLTYTLKDGLIITFNSLKDANLFVEDLEKTLDECKQILGKITIVVKY